METLTGASHHGFGVSIIRKSSLRFPKTSIHQPALWEIWLPKSSSADSVPSPRLCLRLALKVIPGASQRLCQRPSLLSDL